MSELHSSQGTHHRAGGDGDSGGVTLLTKHGRAHAKVRRLARCLKYSEVSRIRFCGLPEQHFV